MLLDLAIVMPVYNEKDCIIDVVNSWHSILSRLNISFLIILLNDGSTDGTRTALSVFNDEDSIKIIDKKNTGHGPTILLGYKRAVDLANWVFQCDSDNEMKADFFPTLWEKRSEFDALFGIRDGRNQRLGRKFISLCSRLTVRLVFGKGVTDVNTPFRLIRANILKQIIKEIPDHAFAPNIIISGALSKSGSRVYEQNVPHEKRQTGSVSIVKWKLWKSAGKSLWQTLSCRSVGKVMDH
jgi:glycosyltransferase involved in cell wall biosynthesis